MATRTTPVGSYYQAKLESLRGRLTVDYWLFGAVVILLMVGFMMMSSASSSIAERQLNDAYYFMWHQLAHIIIGVLAGWYCLTIKISTWEKINPLLLIVGMFLLLSVLVFGREINGSSRWLSFGFFNVQPSEIMKLFVVLFMAGYLVRRGEEVRTTIKGFLKPIILISVIAIMLLLEPDFGATAVICITTFGMLFIGGLKLRQFAVLLIMMSVSFITIALAAPYRVERLKSFLNPWADPFDSGFQLTQALIAFGRGEWFGVGLGASIQKLFYLPEAHTDFLFAVLSEELGLLGMVFIIGLFGLIVLRAFYIGLKAFEQGHEFAAYCAYGIGLLIGIQAFTNIGVNMGVLPTKGLTLPFMSYGGSSIVMTCIASAILLRIHHENQPLQASYAAKGRRHKKYQYD